MKKTLFVFTALCLAVTVMAQEEEKKSFKNTLSIGVTMTDGNSENMQANASIVSEGEKEGLGSVRAGAEGNYAENTVEGEDNTTVENARAFANAKKTISAKTFGCLDGSVLYDDISLVDYRTTIGPGLGFYPVKNDSTSLCLEAGPSYVWEKMDGVKDDYMAIRFAERLDQALSKTAKAWQAVEYLPKADDFDDYFLTVEAGVEAAMNARINLRLVLQNKHDSTPATDMEKDDTSLVAGISLSI